MTADEYRIKANEQPHGTAVISIGPEKDERISVLYSEGVKLREYALAREIKTNEDLIPATEDLAIIGKALKSIGEYRRSYTDPIRGHLDAVNAVFKDFIAPLTEADALNRNKIKAYQAEVDRKIAEAEAINQEKVELARREAILSGTGEISVDLTPVETPDEARRRVHTSMGSIGSVKHYKFEITDLSKVPMEYLMPNTVLIGQVVRSSKGQIVIPGIRVFVDEDVRVGTR